MDRSGDNTPFSFQRLLFEDDWHRWDTYSTVDANAVSTDPTAEVYLDTLQMMSDYLTALSWEGTEYCLQEEYHIHPNNLTQEEMEFVDLEFVNLEFVDEDIEDYSTGLNAELLIENIRLVKYESCGDETKKCVICLEELKYNEEVSKLECGHDFHFGCIKNWLMVKNECPLCKQKAI